MTRLFLPIMALLAILTPSIPCFGKIVDVGSVVPLTGDVNADHEVNIADINAAIDLMMGGGYTPAADVNSDGELSIADVNAIIDIILGCGEPTPDYVDLGLPSGTVWATRNVGAIRAEDSGDYFAWGETEPKEVYNISTYKWCNGSARTLTKYCTDSTYGYNGFVDGKTELDPEDDAAYVHYPGGRMPTKKQMDELRDFCSWQWIERNGVNGQLVTGPNGNTLFLPAGGYKNDSTLKIMGVYGFYWSRDCRTYNSYFSWSLRIESDGYGYGNTPRVRGFLVRGVLDAPADGDDLYIGRHYLDLGEVPIGVTRTDELVIFNRTDEAAALTVTADEPFSLSLDGRVSSMAIEVPSHSISRVTVMFAADETGDFNGHVTFRNPSFDSGQSVVRVHASAISETEQHECVDLGLPSGTLWATTNVGASAPEDYGGYFAWGETTTKFYYDWNTYKWCLASLYAITKYSTDGTYGYSGFVDGKTELEPNDDAAWVNWGPAWRMPSQEQMDELCRHCNWQDTTRNDVNGFLVTGPNGNTIFLPKAGLCYVRSLHDAATYGYYWTRTLHPAEDYDADCLRLSGAWRLSSYDRTRGLSVRPVRATD